MECITKDNPSGIGNPNELNFEPKIHVKSKFKPPLAPFFVENKLYKFRDMITKLHGILPNLPNFNIDKIQRNILSSMRNNINIIFINLDKNQGLVAMDCRYYITCMLQQHCLNEQNYKPLSPSEAFQKYEKLSNNLKYHHQIQRRNAEK